MRWMWLGLAIAACSGTDKSAAPPKAPNNELIIGTFERHAGGTTAIRFRADGSFRIGHDRNQIDKDPPVGSGTWQLDKDVLTLHGDAGWCADKAGTKDGTYQVVISKIGVHFKKQQDSCEARSKIDGETWWRLK